MSGVLTSLGVLLAIGGVFLLAQSRHAGGAPIRVGTIFVLAILVYSCYPLLIYVALDGFYTPLNDLRLFLAQPEPAEVARISYYHSLYLLSFCIGYALVWPASRAPTVISFDIDFCDVWALLVSFVSCRLVLLGADALLAARSDSYSETYLRFSHLPLVAQQLLGHLQGMTSILALATMALLCRHWKDYWWVVCVWLLLEFVLLLGGMGARTQFVLLCLSALFSYHYLCKPITTRTFLVAGAVILVAFLGVGVLRQYGSAGALAFGLEALAGTSEFESLFSNAYDIDQRVASGAIDRASIATTVYLGDLINLIPQQLVPFEKLSLPNWYVRTFYPEFSEQGGGLAFGAVAEGLVGGGWPDLLWRGFIVGVFFRWVDRTVETGTVSFWKFVLFLWLMGSSYLIFRTTTLALIPVFLYRFLPALLGVSALAYLLRAAAIPPVPNSLPRDPFAHDR